MRRTLGNYKQKGEVIPVLITNLKTKDYYWAKVKIINVPDRANNNYEVLITAVRPGEGDLHKGMLGKTIELDKQTINQNVVWLGE